MFEDALKEQAGPQHPSMQILKAGDPRSHSRVSIDRAAYNVMLDSDLFDKELFRRRNMPIPYLPDDEKTYYKVEVDMFDT